MLFRFLCWVAAPGRALLPHSIVVSEEESRILSSLLPPPRARGRRRCLRCWRSSLEPEEVRERPLLAASCSSGIPH